VRIPPVGAPKATFSVRTAAAESRDVTLLGGLGFIGSHLARALLRDGYRVRILCRQNGTNELPADFRDQLEVAEIDAMNPRQVFDSIADSDTLVDLVHTTRPGSSMENPSFDVASNLVSRVEWLQHLGETKVRRVIFLSSGGTVYGIPETDLIGEDHPTNPICSYGITKLALEKYVAMYAGLSGISCTILRPSNVYGPGNRVNVGQGVIGVLADRALRGQALEVWGDGSSLRDYLYIDDLVSAIVGLMSYFGSHRVFNVSSGTGYSVIDVIATLRDVLGCIPPVLNLPSRQFDVPVNVLSSTRLRESTGWVPRVDLRSGVERVIEWLSADGF
jgi:UDP-glucose 4-epimerase